MVAAGLLAGCQVGPAFRSPTLAVPPRFAAASPANAPPTWPKPGWWRAFGSPELSSLVEAARQHNFSVREAIAQLEIANAEVLGAGAPLLPNISASGSGSFSQFGTGAAGSSSGSSRFSSVGGNRNIDTHTYAAGFNASYELDFWARIATRWKRRRPTPHRQGSMRRPSR